MNLSKHTINFTVFGEPVAKARARVFRNKYSGKIMAYTPEKTHNAENDFKSQSLPHKPKEPIMTPIWLNINVFRGIPASFSPIKKGVAQSGQLLPTTRPDIDNYAKLVMDSMNGLFWKDDRQIVSLTINKYYSDNPRIEVGVMW